jgi:ankyrin repeat protein
LYTAYQDQQWNIFKLLFEYAKQLETNTGDGVAYVYMMDSLSMVASDGLLDLVKFLCASVGVLSSGKPFKRACVNDHMTVAKFLWARRPLSHGELCANNNTLFSDVCSEGYLDVVQFLWERRPLSAAELCTGGNGAFTRACTANRLNIVQFLWGKRLLTVEDLKANNSLIIQLTCASGAIDVVNFLWSLDLLNAQDLRGNNDYALHAVCRAGYSLEVLEFLLTNADLNEKDITADDNSCLKAACANVYRVVGSPERNNDKYREIVKLLCVKGSPYDNEYEGVKHSFLEACRSGHHYTVAVLRSLKLLTDDDLRYGESHDRTITL